MRNPNWQYLKYVMRHKWFVFLGGLKTKAPLWNLIIHDWSKFRPSEWVPYVDYFYRRGGKATHDHNKGAYKPGCDEQFDEAWIRHQHRNPHHWQHWCLLQDDGETKTLKMPLKYVREMVADWIGAGRAQGHNDLVDWYKRNRKTIRLHPDSREWTEEIIQRIDPTQL